MTESIQILNPSGEPAREAMTSYTGAGNGYAGQLSRWNVNSKSADAAILPTFDAGNARAADLVRNDGYAKSGVQLHIDHIVGHQFKLVYKPNYLLLGLDISSEEVAKFTKMVEAKFTNFAEDPRCYIDAERKRTFTMLIREGIGTHCKAGEITAKAEYFNKRGSKYKTAIKMIDYARISNPDGAMDTKHLKAGVKSDKHGAALGYHVRTSHPSEGGLNFLEAYTWQYIPRELHWGRQQFIHVFEPEGEGQTRGVNNFLAALSKLKMLEKFQATTLQNAITNAMYAATIESELDSSEVFKALGGSESGSQMLSQFMNAKADFHEETGGIKLDGVAIPHLLPNEKLSLQGVSAPSGNLAAFENGILRNIAKSLGVSFEQLSGNFSDTNYSSARAAMGEAFKYFLGKREVIAKAFANAIFTLWFEEAVNLGDIVLPKNANGNFYEMKTAWTRCNWIGAGKTQIDGLKGVKEAIEKISAGLSTYEKEFGNMGEDYQEMFAQQYRETLELAKMGRKPIWLTAEKSDNSDDDDEEETPRKKMKEQPETNTNE